VTPRPQREPDQTTYAGRVAARLRQLREKRGWSIGNVQDLLAERGHVIPSSNLYAYERGKAGGGVDLPVNLYPAIAHLYGFKTANGWLPDA